jgi:hypothetical protein
MKMDHHILLKPYNVFKTFLMAYKIRPVKICRIYALLVEDLVLPPTTFLHLQSAFAVTVATKPNMLIHLLYLLDASRSSVVISMAYPTAD